MARGMSDDVSDVIVQALARGLSRGQISGVVGISKRSVTRISTNLTRYGSAKAPPSGVKMGRPARMTKAQAESMLAWMDGKDYTFYVKDLVAFLRETSGYAGCEGTVRRCLLRAGFTRKLPWHKSQITTWIPPDHPPEFHTLLETSEEQPVLQFPTEQEASIQQPDQGPPEIDPALRDATSVVFNNDSDGMVYPSQAQFTAPSLPSNRASADASLINSFPHDMNTFEGHPFASKPLLPPPIQAQPTSLPPPAQSPPSPAPLTPQPMIGPAKPPHPLKPPSKRRRAKPPPEAPDEPLLSSQVATLQDEVARQHALILHLQQQLVDSNPSSSPQHGELSALPAAQVQMLRNFTEAQDLLQGNGHVEAERRSQEGLHFDIEQARETDLQTQMQMPLQLPEHGVFTQLQQEQGLLMDLPQQQDYSSPYVSASLETGP